MMPASILSFFSGLIFSAGLVLSGMINPFKVKRFLDIFSDWDYSLAFVMGGAVFFNLITFRLIQKKGPVFSSKFFLTKKSKIDCKLILGSILFGIGWGLSGMCPGPALVNLATFKLKVVVFVASMLTGMYVYKVFQQKLKL